MNNYKGCVITYYVTITNDQCILNLILVLCTQFKVKLKLKYYCRLRIPGLDYTYEYQLTYSDKYIQLYNEVNDKVIYININNYDV